MFGIDPWDEQGSLLMCTPEKRAMNQYYSSKRSNCVSPTLLCILILLCILALSLQCYAQERHKVSLNLPDIERVLPRVYGKFDSEMIVESSGMVKSRIHDNMFWTHNDSGDSARLFAVDRYGRLILPPDAASYEGIAVHGAENVDWEGIACDNNGGLYIGDTGNNNKNKELFVVYKIVEPSPTEAISVLIKQHINVFYPDRDDPSLRKKRVNAEALFWAKDYLFFITKAGKVRHSDLYALSLDELEEENPLILNGSFDFKGMVTGADASADGNKLAVLTYNGVWLFEVEEDSIDYFHGAVSWLPIRAGQCEAICFDGKSLLISNEQGRLYKILLHDLVPLSHHTN